MSFDPRSYDLAELFLSDEADLNTPANRNRLAQYIQTGIEDWIASERADFADAKFEAEMRAAPTERPTPPVFARAARIEKYARAICLRVEVAISPPAIDGVDDGRMRAEARETVPLRKTMDAAEASLTPEDEAITDAIMVASIKPERAVNRFLATLNESGFDVISRDVLGGIEKLARHIDACLVVRGRTATR